MQNYAEFYSKVQDNTKNQRFVGEQLSKDYAKYRLDCEPELIEQVISYLKEKVPGKLHRALDVGCGTGQCTKVLAPYFDEVLGIDSSPTQIQEAQNDPQVKSLPNVSYKVGIAEELPFEDSSVELITASTAFHWFDREPFMKEVQRILVPNGILAVCSVGKEHIVTEDPETEKKIFQVESEYYKDVLKMDHPELFLDREKILHRDLVLTELKDHKRIEVLFKNHLELREVIERTRSFNYFGRQFGKDSAAGDAAIEEVFKKLKAAAGFPETESSCPINVEQTSWCVLGRL